MLEALLSLAAKRGSYGLKWGRKVWSCLKTVCIGYLSKMDSCS